MQGKSYLFSFWFESHYLLILCALFPAHSFAWNYAEHVQISHKSLEQACVEKAEEISGLAQKFCLSNSAKICFSHMVALAGDHVRNVKRMKEPTGRLLTNSKVNVDCRNLHHLLNSNDSYEDKTQCTDVDSEKCYELGKRGLIGKFDYLSLLPNNTAHFAPGAHEAWEEHFRNSTSTHDEGSDTKNLVHQLIELAFSMHFLQDSFASGHNGLDRRGHKQEYGQAYHDGFNQMGMFLKNNQGDLWKSYGDGRLREASYYYLEDPCDASSHTEFLSFLEESIGIDLDDSEPKGYEELCNKPASKDEIDFMSLAFEEEHGLKEGVENIFYAITPGCRYWDTCEKIEVVLGLHEKYSDVHIESDSCSSIVDGKLIQCKTGEFMVTRATKRSISLFLDSLLEIDNPFCIDSSVGEIRDLFPAKFQTYEVLSGNVINNDSSFLRYTHFKKISKKENYPEKKFTANSLYLYRQKSDRESLEDLTGGISFTSKEKFGFRVEGGLDWMSYNSHRGRWTFFDGIQFTGGYELPRFFFKLIGLTIEGSVGVDDIWEGKKGRNAYHGYALELDIHAGRNIVFFEYSKKEHLFDGPNDTSEQWTVGWRVASINM